ncbi:MAG: zinc ribbon domain-containing protein [Candidatus Helarchaeota archaeon]
MSSETDEISPETFEKRVKLSELIFERNNLIKLMGGFKRKKRIISQKQLDILINEYISKIALIDRQMSRVAAGFSCPVCHEVLTITDEVLACEWCGTPSHDSELIKYVKSNGCCPSCGESLRPYSRNSMKTVTHDLFKEFLYSAPKKIPLLKIHYTDKPLTQSTPSKLIQCPKCHRPISPDWKFCRHCGTRLRQEPGTTVQKVVCPRCGRQVKKTWKFCKLCGYPLSNLR